MFLGKDWKSFSQNQAQDTCWDTSEKAPTASAIGGRHLNERERKIISMEHNIILCVLKKKNLENQPRFC